MKLAIWKAAVRTAGVTHAACETHNNGEGRVRRRRCWPEPRQPGPDTGVILTNSKKCPGSRTPRQNPDSGLKAGAEAPCAPDHVCSAEENTNKNISHLLYARYLLTPCHNLRRKPPPASPMSLYCPGPDPKPAGTGARAPDPCTVRPGHGGPAPPQCAPSSPEQLPRAPAPSSFQLGPSAILIISPRHPSSVRPTRTQLHTQPYKGIQGPWKSLTHCFPSPPATSVRAHWLAFSLTTR